MSRLDSIFSSGPACIVPMVLGDPDLDTTLAMAKELLRAGADAIELHLPFSDPTAEGELMQNGALRALKNGVSVKDAITFTQKADVYKRQGHARHRALTKRADHHGVDNGQ